MGNLQLALTNLLTFLFSAEPKSLVDYSVVAEEVEAVVKQYGQVDTQWIVLPKTLLAPAKCTFDAFHEEFARVRRELMVEAQYRETDGQYEGIILRIAEINTGLKKLSGLCVDANKKLNEITSKKVHDAPAGRGQPKTHVYVDEMPFYHSV